ncbi:xanthine dehydrogenase family protein molybdopterin-binding subunit [Bowmanella sp. Y26]|uniref:xanthine dehydrogenase family protein molybdopterin-binding subunit n=1 Tax=Bowmanella yangjiangensis TaxID=2811230 RepID=UPI001BDCFD35|nr:xanthine dehydrogenase family protein molybdopterin-binding subunit [Bowmanella yangjiangensis]MBT1065079.1 xanthine dehydrogenase family protein molybdopterin-binding subunit [Bowmanella yangjiangensis]
MSEISNVSRRQFLKLTGIGATGLVLGGFLPGFRPAWAQGGDALSELNLFVSIGSDDLVQIICHRSEMGQGIRTGLPQVVADELMADWQKVRVVQGLANAEYGSQNTDGSRSVRRFYQTMREMGASARTMLEQAAANHWQVPVEEVQAKDHQVLHGKTGRSLRFGELAEAASKLTPPAKEQLKLKSASDFNYIGKDVPIVDMQAILTGSSVYGQDVQLPGMLYASIERTPVVGANVKAVDNSAALKVSGVVDTFVMPAQSEPVLFKPLPGVAVLATNSWAAMQGRKALAIEWTDSPHAAHDSQAYLEVLKGRVKQQGKVVRSVGDAYVGMMNAVDTFEAGYSVPYLIHAPMEPPAATAVFSDGSCEIWACTQTPQSTQQNVANALGIEPGKVKVNVTLLGGGFGRKSKPDFSVEAAILAKHTGKPVKVSWNREDEIQHGYYHAMAAMYFQAGMDETGRVVSWVQRTAFPSISWTFTGTSDEPSDSELDLGFGDLPFALDNLSCESQKAEAHLRIGWVRSVSNIQHGFAIGSFVDELADKLERRPRDMWLELLGDDRLVDPEPEGFKYGNYGESKAVFPIDTARLKGVLNLVADKAGVEKTTAKNEAWGISVHRSFVSYVAVATKVRVEGDKVQVLEMHSAIDAGTVVNPDRVKSQMEGAMIFGLSLAMMGDISVKAGAVEQSNFHDYPLLRINQSPQIHSYIVESSQPPGGVGEPGVPPVAASLCNAIFRASGKRIRDLPISKHMQV